MSNLLPHLSRRPLLAGMAASALATLPPAARAQSAATAPVAALDNALLAAMKSGRAVPFAQRAAALEPVIQRSFDLPAILRASVGPRYASMTPAEQSALLAAFTQYTVATYVANFDSYTGERFTLSPQTRASGADQVVSTQLVPARGTPTRLDYVMRHGPAGWQIVDVLVDGSISRVAVQRSDFRGVLAGGGARALIASLQAKAARLASGQKS